MTEQIVVAGAINGKLLVASTCSAFLDRFALAQGDTEVPFRPHTEDVGRLQTGLDLLATDSEARRPARWSAPAVAGVSLSKNLNREWMLEDLATWTLAAPPSAAGVVVTYHDDVFGNRIPVRAGLVYQASGRFAAHQASGVFRVVALDGGGGILQSVPAEFRNDHRGGTEPDDYQDLTIRFKVPRGATHVRLEVEFAGHISEGTAETNTGFVIFTDCSLIATPDRAPVWSPLPDSIPLLAQAAGGLGRVQLFEAPLKIGADSGVGHVEVVAVDGSLTSPVAKFALSDMSKVEASIEGFAGNAVKVKIKGSAEGLALYIDGERAGVTAPVRKKRALVSRRASIAVAERFCDGNVHALELRDSTGNQVLAWDAAVLPAALTPWAALQTYSSDPLPYHLAPASVHRYRALRVQLERVSEQLDTGTASEADLRRYAQLSRVHRCLELGFDKLTTYAPLDFPKVDAPKVSVIIPAHNKFNVTYYCLAALLFAANNATFEVIVVDDGSIDETVDLGNIAPNVTVCRNEVAKGFVRACNLGVEAARGEYVVLLNNDTEPTVGWLDALLRAFDNFDGVGMAGSKLLYPDGRLQDAGGIVWASGNPWNYGRGANPADPRFSYSRQADYLSGASVMLPRKVWDEVGGLSDEFAPAYFEDTDLAFKVRDAGYTTWFIPTSQVYHYEGVSNGTDVNTTSGLKRFQEVNRPKFKQKWAAAVVHNGVEGEHPDWVKDRGICGRILFVDHSIPRPDRDAGGYAALQEMLLVQSLGFKVTFAPINFAYMGHYTDDLNDLGIETIHAPFALSIGDLLEQRGSEFDGIFITRYNVAMQVVADARRHAPQAKIMFNNADLHFLRELRAAQLSKSPEQLARAREVRDKELAIMRDVDVVLSYNEVEHAVITSHNFADSKVVTCPWVVDTVEGAVPEFEEREGIAFLGGYLHPPNLEAVEFFVAEVLPGLRERLPSVRFNIYGSNMPDALRALADDVVNPVGHVKTVDEVYMSNRVFVAPLLTGAGIKGKVLGALSQGIPSVLSPVAAEGTRVREELDCLVARTPEEWVESVARLYQDPETWARMSANAREFTLKHYSFDNGRKLMAEALSAVGLYGIRA